VTVYRTTSGLAIRSGRTFVVWLLALAGAATVLAAFVLGALGPPRPSLADAPNGYFRDGSGRLLTRSYPTSIAIPAIGVSASVLPTGLADDGSIQVPPADQPDVAGWYRYGPSPGEAGSAVIVGHVDTRATGPAVFFNLGRLHKGDTISVVRNDGRKATFAVTGVQLVAKDAFPADEVHRTSSGALLRLITCGGAFNSRQHSYVDNVIVYAAAVS
jgi:LPXTG-site transpeptidase (sortase) family protein